MRNPPSIVMKNDNALIEGSRSLPLKEDKQRARPHKLADMSSAFLKKVNKNSEKRNRNRGKEKKRGIGNTEF